MLAHVRGKIVRLAPTFAVMEIGGWGMKISCTPATLSTLREGMETTLYTSLVAQRDDIPALYGFSDEDERDIYEIMQSVSGIGAKVALAMLSVHTPNALRAAVENKDEAALTRVPGIGKKTAQRIILELSNKLGPATGDVSGEPTLALDSGLVQALADMGWQEKDAQAAYVQAHENNPGAQPAELLRASLQILGARR